MRHLLPALALLLASPALAQEDDAPPAQETAPDTVSGGGNNLGGAGIGLGSGGAAATNGGRGNAPDSSNGSGEAAPPAGDFKVVDLDKLPTRSGHWRIDLKGMKGLAVRVTTKNWRGRMFTFQTGTYLGGQASDVTFKAAISKSPGDMSPAYPCAIKGVYQDGAGQTRAYSQLKVVVAPSEPPLGATDREKQMFNQSSGYVKKGQACPLAAESVYYYNIIGDCDYASIAHQNSMGWNNQGPANGCPVSLSNNGVSMLAPGFDAMKAAAGAAAGGAAKGPKYHGLTPDEEKQYQAWLASLPPNIRTVYQSGSDGARYQWWQTYGGGKK